MSFTWIWPLAAGGVFEPGEVEVIAVVGDDDDAVGGSGEDFPGDVGGGRILNSGACSES